MRIDGDSMEKVLLVLGGVALGAAIGYMFRDEIQESLQEVAEMDLLSFAQDSIETEEEA